MPGIQQPRPTGVECGHCDRPVPDGAPICPQCTGLLVEKLREVPDLLGELLTSMSRQDRISAVGGHHAKRPEPPTPIRFDASDRLATLCLRLITSAYDLVQVHGWDVPNPQPRVAHNGQRGPVFLPSHPRADLAGYAAALLAEHPAELRRHPDAATMYRAVDDAITAAENAIDKPEARLFIGRCDCGANLYSRPDSSSTRCESCRELVTDVADRWDMALRKLRLYPATASQIAGAVGELYGVTVTADHISQWHHRGEIRLYDEVPMGAKGGRVAPRFRIGDVLDRASRSVPRRKAS